MKVGINARLLASPDVRGFNRYTAELVRALGATGRAEPVLFSQRPLHPVHRLEGFRVVCAPVRPQFRWQHAWLPRALRRERVEVFHAPAQWGIPWVCPCPSVATIHDVADWERPHVARPGLSVVAARNALEMAIVVRRAARIVTVSEWSARSIIRHLGGPAERVAVTVEGAAPAFVRASTAQVEAARREAGLPDRYFLYVGGFDERKNVGALVRALALTPPARRTAVALVGGDLVGAGLLADDARRAGVAEWLRLLGSLDDARLAALYSGALALVLPSWLEGFGLPVVEAMHCGTPAIVADAASLPEIAGEAALTFPPADAAALAAQMVRLAEDPDLRALLVARAPERAARFTWAHAAEQTAAIYEEVLSEG